MRILIADDNKVYTQRVARFIERSMPHVPPPACAADGQEALALAQEMCGYRDGGDTIAFIDVRMPHMDGLTLITKLRAQFPRMRIVLISAYDDKEYLFQAIRLGAYDYLVKPVEHEAILLHLKKFDESLHPAAEALTHLAEEETDANALLCQQFQHYVAGHFREDLSLAVLAEKLFCSKSLLTGEVRKQMGVTVMQHIHRVRMEQAVLLLRRPGLSVGQVAHGAGFSDTNYFIRRFKQQYGVTPAVWRRRHLGGGDDARAER